MTSEDTLRYQLTASQTAVGPVLESNAPPVYPPALLASNLPTVVITATVIVAVDGHVKDVRFADTDSNRAWFRNAVTTAVKQWHFKPLRITRWETRPDGSEVRVANDAKPFSQVYEFRFKVVDGKGLVSSLGSTR